MPTCDASLAASGLLLTDQIHSLSLNSVIAARSQPLAHRLTLARLVAAVKNAAISFLRDDQSHSCAFASALRLRTAIWSRGRVAACRSVSSSPFGSLGS